MPDGFPSRTTAAPTGFAAVHSATRPNPATASEAAPKTTANSSPEVIIIGELIASILQDETRQVDDRKRAASAIRSLCRDLQIDLTTAPATHTYLRRALAGVTHHRLGIESKTLQNRKSSIHSAIDRYATAVHKRGRAGLNPLWADLYSVLPKGGDLRYGLTRLLRYLSDQEIDPSAVTDDVAEPFLDWLTHRTSVRNPAQLHRRCIVLWNKAARSVRQWPRFNFTVPNRDVGYVIEWDAINSELRAEVEVWLAAQANPDPFNFDRPPRPAAPDSLKAWRFQIRQIVSAAGLQGIDIGTLRSFSQLIEPEICERILRFFWERFGAKRNQTAATIAGTFLKIGRYWCKVDDQRLRHLTAIKKNLSVDRRGMRAGVRERLAQFKDRYNVEQLLMLPVRIVERFRRLKHVSVEDALELQIAVAVELLLMCPLRRRNLVKLRLGRDGHFRFNRDRRGAIYIIIPGDEVKNKEPIDAPIPRETADLLRTYLERARPVLSEAPGD